jgi:hypothetical protein
MRWVPASYGGNKDGRRGWSFVIGSGSFAAWRIPRTTKRRTTVLRSGFLKVDDHDRLEGLSLAIADVGPIAPLLYRVDGGGCQDSVSIDQSHALNLARLINDFLEDDRSLCFSGTRVDGIFRRYAVSQAFLSTLGRENNRAVLPGQRGVGRSRSSGVFLAVARLAGFGLATPDGTAVAAREFDAATAVPGVVVVWTGAATVAEVAGEPVAGVIAELVAGSGTADCV